MRARIDWKFALGLQLTDPGFDFSVLSEFHSRLVKGGREGPLLEKLLEGCKERGYLKARGRQRADSTHVLGALRVLSQLEQTAETMRAALNAHRMPESVVVHASQASPTHLFLQPREEHEAIQFAKKRQKTEEFASLYCRRAGVEGTVSQGVRAFGLRQARY